MTELFTVEARQVIQKCMDDGNYENIASAILIEEPRQEMWIQSLVNVALPEYKILESKVEKEMLEATRRGEVIDTPEKEAEWQAKIDAEKAFSVVTPTGEVEVVITDDETETPDTDEVLALKAELDAKGIKYRKNATLKTLKGLLDTPSV